MPCLCCIIDSLRVDVWLSYWWNEPNSSITIKSLHLENQCRSTLSCSPVFYVLLRHTNIMPDKGFNLFDKCAARCVHVFPQEDLSGKWYWQALNTFRIIYSEMNIPLLILNWWCFSSLHIQRIGIQYTDQLTWHTQVHGLSFHVSPY